MKLTLYKLVIVTTELILLNNGCFPNYKVTRASLDKLSLVIDTQATNINNDISICMKFLSMYVFLKGFEKMEIRWILEQIG